MYHPAAGLHQVALKDVIREDFRKIPKLIEEAERIAVEVAPIAEKAKKEEEPPQQMSLF